MNYSLPHLHVIGTNYEIGLAIVGIEKFHFTIKLSRFVIMLRLTF